MELLKESLRSLIKVSKDNPNNTYLLPLAGLGHGEGSIEEILPLLIKTVQASPNIKLVIPAENVNLGRQGTVRKDYTRENMPQIKDMLSKAGLLTTQPVAEPKMEQGSIQKSGTKGEFFVYLSKRLAEEFNYSNPNSQGNKDIQDIFVTRRPITQEEIEEAKQNCKSKLS
jgi:hypothetical protein